MKRILLCIIILVFIGCKSNHEPDNFKLAGTYWAMESDIPDPHAGTMYYYRVWHFKDDKEAEQTRYATGTTRVDIGHGDDPAKYGYDTNDEKTTIRVNYFEYPKISIIIESYNQFSQSTEKVSWNGEFLTENLLIMNETRRFLRIIR